MKTLLKNTRILIVDDNTDTCELLRVVLEQSGASVAVAQSVEGAVQVFRRNPPHAVITDIRLGSSDGYALLEAIRKCNTEYKGFTPVVALTGYASPEDEERAKLAGFHSYLYKPFDPEVVVDALSKALGGPADAAA